MSRDQGYGIDRARQDLAFTPSVDFDAGMAATLRWVESEEGRREHPVMKLAPTLRESSSANSARIASTTRVAVRRSIASGRRSSAATSRRAPVPLPGRGLRFDEQPYTRMAPLVEGVLAALRPTFD